MTAENTAMPKLLGLYETHLTVANLQTSTDFYRDIVGLEPPASFEERKVAFLWVDDRKTGMLGLWEAGPDR
ncbi:catechol-2,3-dioxygenase [Rhizobium sp. BK456]|nr:catechol-2,3-dioxygenase [Rhizobium sp. BK456]